MARGNGAAAPKSSRSGYTYAFKVKVIDEYIAGGVTAPELAKKHGLANEQLVYNWRNAEKAIRKRAKKEAGNEPETEATQLSRPIVKVAPDEVPPLRIVGLTPLIRALVQQEVREMLGSIVKEEINNRFSGGK